ncbi:ribonuclease P/MRP protein subunit POP8 [Microdochium nivale]|nr:ribonuclease P/MRP protein subunit POP8 [Microdochium nivale]
MAAPQDHLDKMDISATSILSTASMAAKKSSKSLELATSTIRAPPHAYAHLQLLSSSPNGPASDGEQLDALQVKSYCLAALKQFLGLHGSAISFDILKVEGCEGWVRVPRDDLAAFAAAVTAWQGTSSSHGGQHVTLRLIGCSDWLGTLVGRDGEDRVWSG